MMQTKTIIDQVEEHVIHTYNRYQIALDRGEGVYLYDVEGKKYLDFGAGIGVFALGYGNPEYTQAIKNQIDKLIHTSNLFYNEPAALAASKLVEASGMEKVFFTNSGAEAVEGALKIARKYGNMTKGPGNHEIIAMDHSFHGRTMGALSVTGTSYYREPFEDLIPGIHFATYNDLESVKALITSKTAAIILETLQGEGGIYPATEEFIKGVRALCEEHDLLLILDEIQCGMGRTGTMYAYEQYGVVPDVLTTAKALGCGIPVGAFLVRGKAADVLIAGDHGTTYGGNPLAGAAANVVFDLFKNNKILEKVTEVGAYLYGRLEEVKAKHDNILDHRGMGLMQGLEFTEPVAPYVANMIEHGCIVFAAGPKVIRFIPPLIITKDNVDEMIDILEKSIS